MKLNTLTDIGCKRIENQDNYWSALLNVDNEEVGVICLCDGMGGLNNGGTASRLVVQSIRNYLLTEFNLDGLKDVFTEINSKIYSISKGSKDKQMGTTCTLLICYNGVYKIYHVGDSRAYLIRDNEVSQLTTDHSAVRLYNISKQENPTLYKKYCNRLTKCIGVLSDINIDIFDGNYLKGDKFFICSDGCWHYFDDNGFDVNLLNNLDSLFKLCIENGETDNITAGILIV